MPGAKNQSVTGIFLPCTSGGRAGRWPPCRAVLCASLWPDPVDENCPPGFRDAAALSLCYFAEQVQHDEKLAVLCNNHWSRWIRTKKLEQH
jgi:hypothetical protein